LFVFVVVYLVFRSHSHRFSLPGPVAPAPLNVNVYHGKRRHFEIQTFETGHQYHLTAVRGLK
jgi:hypothetical protein